MKKTFCQLTLGSALLIAVITFTAAGLPGFAAAAEFDVTSAECDGPGTFRGAVEAANDNPGPDTVVVNPNLQVIDITQCPAVRFEKRASALDQGGYSLHPCIRCCFC